MILKYYNRTLLFLYASLTLFFLACEKELTLDIPYEPPKLVVEGWIELGKYPEVILSLSAPYFVEIDSQSIFDYAVSRAKVSVIAEPVSEILTLRPNKNYFPPLVYRGMEFTGETNRVYSLEIIYNSDTITAATMIPEPVDLDSVWFKPQQENDSSGQVWIRIHDDPERENFYRILFKCRGKDDRYIPPFTSVFNDKFFDGNTIELGFLKGFSNMLDVEQDNNFYLGDTIDVKFCSIDKEQYDFWNAYQIEVISAINPFSASNFRIESNILGGIGIWGGYSAGYYTVIAE
ncbi:MAG: DUF4249 domain-containing protein [Bacteroidales bacterium]